MMNGNFRFSMKRIMLYFVFISGVFISLARTPERHIMHEWRIVEDERFFNYLDSMLEINDTTPFVDMDPGERQRIQRAKRYYKVVVDNDADSDSIVLNDGRTHKIHITQYRFLKPDVKSTVKHKDRVYFFTARNADVFSTLPYDFLLSDSKILPCLPGQEWDFEYTAPK